MNNRPTLLQMWYNHRGPIPVNEMKRGMVYRISWFPPVEPTIQASEPIPADMVTPTVAEYRVKRGPLGWVLLGRWSDAHTWNALYE